MNENVPFMTLEEVLSFIDFHFFEEGGLIAQIEQRLPIDQTQVKKLKVAFQQLHAAWENSDLVPKQEMQLLWNAISRLEKCSSLYLKEDAAVADFMDELSVWLDQLFTTKEMSEEHAIAVVSQHIIGPSFLREILLGEKVTFSAIDNVFIAVETLAKLWKPRKYVSKLAAGALISTKSITIPNHYSEAERQQLQKIMQQLQERISDCWE